MNSLTAIDVKQAIRNVLWNDKFPFIQIIDILFHLNECFVEKMSIHNRWRCSHWICSNMHYCRFHSEACTTSIQSYIMNSSLGNVESLINTLWMEKESPYEKCRYDNLKVYEQRPYHMKTKQLGLKENISIKVIHCLVNIRKKFHHTDCSLVSLRYFWLFHRNFDFYSNLVFVFDNVGFILKLLLKKTSLFCLN